MRSLLIALSLFAAACGGGGTSGPSNDMANPPAAPVEIRLLFMGNSHASVNNLPGMVAAMVRAARPGRGVEAVEAPEWMFLEERALHRPSLQLLDQPWSFVVLQAQKYSASGIFDYPIDGAISLVGLARAARAVPILFPEWPRLGIKETDRIYDLHVSIARQAPACVAPIGQAWDLSLARHPAMTLHAPDGNHSSPAGAFLAALVIANTMTGMAPDLVPFLSGFNVPAEDQARLRAVAAEAVLVYKPRQHCPADPV